MNDVDSVSRRRIFSRIALAFAGISGFSKLTAAPARMSAARSGSLHAPFRRVVTGISPAGKSVITADGPVPRVAQWTFSADELAQSPYLRGISGNEIWVFDSVPAHATGQTDRLLGKLPDGDQPAPGGILARIHRFEPGTVYPMHETQTVDLIIIVAGALELGLEQGSTIVRRGDVIVQNRTLHSWRVVGDEPCVFVAVMVDAVDSRRTASTPP